MKPNSISIGWLRLLVATLCAGSAMAAPTITNLGVLSSGSPTYAYAGGISANGLVVTGQSSSSAGTRAFRWTAAGGMQNLGALSGFSYYSVGSALSADGAVVTGWSAAIGLNEGRGFRWTAATGMQSIGVLAGGSSSGGNGISSDGSVIAGNSSTNGLSGGAAVRWTAATGMRKVSLTNDQGLSVSADGLAIVGIAYEDGLSRGLRWTAAGGRQVLSLPTGADNAYGYATSADGAVVVGIVSDDATANTFAHAFRWTGLRGGGGGEMQDLGALEGGNFSAAWGLNGDGSVVVGTSTLPGGDRAILWTPTLGTVDLNRYLPSRGVDLTGWTLTTARGVSAEGSAIAGTGTFNGATRAFLVQGLTGLNARAPSAPLLTTFTNPTPADSDLFGTAVAAKGSDKVLIGAEGAGAAYLFRTSGTLLTTFSNPTPAVASHFGVAVAAVGPDRVLIGAYRDDTGAAQAGAAYLFSTDGTLLTTFANPTPEPGEAFGYSVAAVGSDRVLIGAHQDNTDAKGAGAAYLFSTEGTLLTTFTNPDPTAGVAFGVSVAAVEGDRVLIGARFDNAGAGAAYLFKTTGGLVTAFYNPAPAVAGSFGVSVAAVGGEQVLIGAVDAPVATNGGAAYLFSTDGTLVTTFNNPTPGASDYFGWSVAAVGSDRVLIGAYQDYTGTSRTGSAHLFAIDGTLLNTFINPTPALDAFGVSVAAVGSGRVLIGALQNDTGAADSGAAYLFDLPYPPLSISRTGDSVSLSWLTAETGLILQQSDQPGLSSPWSTTPEPVSIDAQANVVQQPIATGITHRFFRLHRP